MRAVILGKLRFDLGHVGEVVFERSIGDEFDVVHAHELLIVQGDAAVTGGRVDDRFVGDGFPDRLPPQPVSKARRIWLAVFVGGPLASQKGLE